MGRALGFSNPMVFGCLGGVSGPGGFAGRGRVFGAVAVQVAGVASKVGWWVDSGRSGRIPVGRC